MQLVVIAFCFVGIAGCASYREHVLTMNLVEFAQTSESTASFAIEFRNVGDEMLYRLVAAPSLSIRVERDGTSNEWVEGQVKSYTDDSVGRNLFNKTQTLTPGTNHTASAQAQFQIDESDEVQFRVSVSVSYESETAKWLRTYRTACLNADGTAATILACEEEYTVSVGTPK